LHRHALKAHNLSAWGKAPGKRPSKHPSPEGAAEKGEKAMSQSLAKIIVHIVFSTKDRVRAITPTIEPELHSYIAGILKQLGCTPIRLGGTDDHVHILCALSKNHAPSKLTEEIKKSSSKWIKSKGPEFRSFYWQRGYGMFSVGQSGVGKAKRYIDTQKEHHRTLSFKDEFLRFLQKYGVEYNEQYLWD
jgi:putative transposase